MKKAENKNNLIHKIIASLLVIILAEVCFLGIKFLSHNKNFINAVSQATTVKPETFTELYFENHLNLPSQIKPNQVYSFSFTVHNLENKTMIYNYNVYLQGNSVKLPIDQNTILIKNTQYKTIHETFSVNAPITRSAIVVKLINKNQQIDFWITSVNTSKTTQTTKTISAPTPTPKPKVTTPHVTAASAKKEYGGWYWDSAANIAMVWLGKDINGQNVWSTSVPK